MSAELQLYKIKIDSQNEDSKAIVSGGSINETEFSSLGLLEKHIEDWIADNPGILGDDLLIIHKQYSGFDKTNARLDLLAVDEDGKVVIIELKRDHTGSDAHWQAIRYASYIHRAQREDIVGILADYGKITRDEASDRLRKHIGADDLNGLNYDQRIILASHRFAPETTIAERALKISVSGKSVARSSGVTAVSAK